MRKMKRLLLRNPMILLLTALYMLGASSRASAAARSVHVVIKNQTTRPLLFVRGEVSHGIVTQRPPSRIPARGTGELFAESSGVATGTEGFVIYRIEGVPGEARFDWDNPFGGSNSFGSSAPRGFATSQIGGHGNRTVIFFFIREAGQTAVDCNPQWVLTHLGVSAEDRLTFEDRKLGWFTTPFKRLGFGGWVATGCAGEATGRVVRDAQHSTDGFWTIDVDLTGFAILDQRLSAHRFVRIEVQPDTPAHTAVEARPPRANEMIRFSGDVLIDTHHGDELIEVHPWDPIQRGDITPGQIFVDAAALSGNGSPQIPFNTLGEAVNAARNGDIIFIRPGSYPPITITKRVSLVKWPGMAGTVVIGR